MKKHFLKSFALIAMLFSALTLSAASGVDWSTYAFLGDGAGGGKYTDKYKVSAAEGLSVVNIQQPGFTTEPSIYATVPAGISDCNVSSTIQGAGIALHLSSFTAQETQVTINYAGGACTFWVYYADGVASEGGDDTPATPTEVYDVNFALTSNGSSAEASSGNAANAIDNNTGGSRWESEAADPQTWTLDLGQARIFNTLEIVWEGAYAKTFTVSVSNDKEVWTPVWTVEGQTLAGFPNTQTQVIDKTTARYIQFQGTERGTQYGYSFWEFRVYLAGVSTLTSLEAKPASTLAKVGEGVAITLTAKDQNGQVMENAGDVTYTVTPADAGAVVNKAYVPAKVGPATIVAAIGEVKAKAFEVFGYAGDNVALSPDINASKIIAQSDFAPSGTDAWHAIDGNENSVWQGSVTNGTTNDEEARTYDSWFVVDLGAYYDINLVTIKFEGACSQAYHVDFSADNTVWNEAYSHSGNAGVNGHTKLIYGDDLQNNTKVRYARFWSTKAATQYGMKIFEFKVFGTAWVAPADTEKPVMGTATLESKTHNSAVILVTATDNTEIGSYHVVDATNSYDKTVGVTNGKITVSGLQANTAYKLTISAKDLAGNESENSVVVEFTTDKHDVKPTAAPEAPTVEAKKVISLYSDTYADTYNFSAHEGWGDATVYQELNFDGNKVRYYTNLNWLGWQQLHGAINALNMEKLHLDIWAENDGKLTVTPIYGGDGLTTDDSKGKAVELKGQQWNSIDLDLATDFVGLNLTSIFQFKFGDAIGGNTFAMDNVYFYRVSEIADTEAPTDVTATLLSASYTSVVLTCKATDDSGTVSFDIFNGETKLATGGAESGVAANITVGNLEAGKTYQLSVVAYDVNENKAAAVTVEATTQALPAPATVPTKEADNVLSIYSNAYTPAWTTLQSFNEGWWAAPQMSEIELAEGDKALYYYGFTTGMIGWQFGEFDATGYTTFSMDIYPLADGTIDCGPLAVGEGNDYARVGISVKGNEWNTITIDLTGKDLTKIYQVKMINYYALQAFFVDNVYLYKAPATDPTGVENNMLDNRSMKVIENGKLIIIRNGVKFDVTGRVVR